ncbi:Uncharacterised protein [Klebsiella pneumoniae]|nr:Uncharacterised protein [Klebsiella pneumoniae]
MNQGLTRRTLIKTMGIGAGIALSNGFLPLAWADEPKPQRGGVLRAAFAGSSSDSTDVLRIHQQ